MATLSIIIEDSLLERVKKQVPARRISKFINEIILEKISHQESSLQHEYAQAEISYKQHNELEDWDKLDNGNW